MSEEPKPGVKTSELGIAGIVGALTVWNDKLADLPSDQLWAIVVLAVAYILSRTIVKWRGTVIYETDPDSKALGEEIRRLRK